jgi:hypothetical protein
VNSCFTVSSAFLEDFFTSTNGGTISIISSAPLISSGGALYSSARSTFSHFLGAADTIALAKVKGASFL